MNPDLNSLFIGKVLYDSDISDKSNDRPLGRVRVLIEGISMGSNTREVYKYPLGTNVDSTVSQQTYDLVGQEVWAYVLQPIMGESTVAKYNPSSGIANASDGNYPDKVDATPPSAQYPIGGLSDGFISNSIGTAGINATGASYYSDNRANSARGLFTVPVVGSTVLVSFINGRRGTPIILGVISSDVGVASVHGAGANIYPSYPLAYSNIK